MDTQQHDNAPFVQDPDPGSDTEAIEAHLAKMSRLFFKLNNEAQWDTLLNADWIAPEFTAALRYQPGVPPGGIGLQQHIQEYKQHKERYPDLIETTSHIEAKLEVVGGRRAKVFIHHETHGSESNFNIPGVVTFMWRKTEAGKWLFYKAVDVRGLPF